MLVCMFTFFVHFFLLSLFRCKSDPVPGGKRGATGAETLAGSYRPQIDHICLRNPSNFRAACDRPFAPDGARPCVSHTGLPSEGRHARPSPRPRRRTVQPSSQGWEARGASKRHHVPYQQNLRERGSWILLWVGSISLSVVGESYSWIFCQVYELARTILAETNQDSFHRKPASRYGQVGRLCGSDWACHCIQGRSAQPCIGRCSAKIWSTCYRTNNGYHKCIKSIRLEYLSSLLVLLVLLLMVFYCCILCFVNRWLVERMRCCIEVMYIYIYIYIYIY